jgi:hypothetical protein
LRLRAVQAKRSVRPAASAAASEWSQIEIKAALEMDSDEHLIKAFLLNLETMPLQPAPVQRDWMEKTRENFANRCLPLRIANQFGWFLLNTEDVQVTWDGGEGREALKVSRATGKRAGPATSHFGQGILTWQLPYLFRTPPGYNLYVRGPTNYFKDGAHALDGIIESDWAVASFTMNWKITCIGVPVHFVVGEPIAMIMPVARGELEKFQVVIEDIGKEPALHEQHRAWAMSRAQFSLALPKSKRGDATWQKHYFFGKAIEGPAFPDHQTALELKPVTDQTGLVNGRPHLPRPKVVFPADSPDRNQRIPVSIFRRLLRKLQGRASRFGNERKT